MNIPVLKSKIVRAGAGNSKLASMSPFKEVKSKKMKRSYYQNTTDKFLTEDSYSIFGQLAKNHQHDLEDQQKNAWLKQIDFLKSWLKDLQGNLYFEFSIPRMGKRVDNILIINNFIFVIEFKIGDMASASRAPQPRVISPASSWWAPR